MVDSPSATRRTFPASPYINPVEDMLTGRTTVGIQAALGTVKVSGMPVGHGCYTDGRLLGISH